MGMKNKIKIALASTCFLSGILTGQSLAIAQTDGPASSITGKYCEKYSRPVAMDNLPNTPCEAPAYIRKLDRSCVIERVTEDYVQLKQNDDGSLDFALSLWYPPYTDYCGIVGHASPAPDGGWIYQDDMNSDSDYVRCTLHIKDKGDQIEFTNDPDATCRSKCGFHVNLTYLYIPKVLKKSDQPDDMAFDESYYMIMPDNGGPTCDEQVRRYPGQTLIKKYVPAKEQ